MTSDAPLLEARDLTVHFPVRRGVMRRQVGVVHAVDGVSFELRAGETLGVVGESGCGKTTMALALLRLVPITGGRVVFGGRDITALRARELQPLRRRLQIVFQDPYSSLNPRITVGELVAEPMLVHRLRGSDGARRARAAELLRLVGLEGDIQHRYPTEFSGGQRQRIAIARALAVEPELLVCDEPVSALDVSIQAQVLNLLLDLQRQLGLAYVFIAHGLDVVRYVSTRVAVMYLGQIVETAPAAELYARPLHPYTVALTSAVPIPDPPTERRRRRLILEGDVPSPIHPPRGCRFHRRCPLVTDRCRIEQPPLTEVLAGRTVACWRWRETETLLPSRPAGA